MLAVAFASMALAMETNARSDTITESIPLIEDDAADAELRSSEILRVSRMADEENVVMVPGVASKPVQVDFPEDSLGMKTERFRRRYVCFRRHR